MNCLFKSHAARTYTRRLAVAMSCYVALLLFSVWALRHLKPDHVTTVLLALLPAIPIVGVIVIVGLYLKQERDEFQRELLIQALLWGMGGTLAVSSVWGFLEANAGTRHFPAFYLFVLFWAIVGLVGVVQRFQYRESSEEGGPDA